MAGEVLRERPMEQRDILVLPLLLKPRLQLAECPCRFPANHLDEEVPHCSAEHVSKSVAQASQQSSISRQKTEELW